MQAGRFKNSYFSIADQLILSIANFVASLVVLFVGGVAQLGIYSFVFVFMTLVASSASTLLHRQMMLAVSSSKREHRRNTLLTTFVLQIAILLVGALVTVSALWFFVPHVLAEQLHLIISVMLYILLFTNFELFRQYLYINGQHASSFLCTLVFALVLAALSIMAFVLKPDNAVTLMYLCLAIAFVCAVLSNRFVLDDLFNAQQPGLKDCIGMFNGYFSGGRFALAGMGLSWLQNQSINPVLMWLGGPVAAGYFSIARMITMPSPIINQGLLNSTAPGMRRDFERNGNHLLATGVLRQAFVALGLVSMLILIIYICHAAGLLQRFVPDYENASPYLAIWLLVIFLMTQRVWASQFFIIRTEFKYLLGVTVSAVAISFAGLCIWALLRIPLPFAILSIAAGELYALVVLTRKRYLILLADRAEYLDAMADIVNDNAADHLAKPS